MLIICQDSMVQECLIPIITPEHILVLVLQILHYGIFQKKIVVAMCIERCLELRHSHLLRQILLTVVSELVIL